MFDRASIGELAKGGPQKVLARDMTEDMIPRHIEYEHTAKVSPSPHPPTPIPLYMYVSTQPKLRSPYSHPRSPTLEQQNVMCISVTLLLSCINSKGA